MLYLRSTDYDPTTRTLTAEFRSPSGTERVTRHYVDVPPGLFARVAAARPHARAVIDQHVAPHHSRVRSS
ncbi:KTSC domain-containing protein [Actinotalea sp. BY-33]|uniref:KTSC domain-containing protein n=1 Tax=Actinotalea soli TaxID=2819234 RepID=A0A939RUM3_9CELL|nr:KTSC domain-containing protein [Actinotalea soli]MBO1750281.1 KTSC domain-containing protein [Actinotalea soli]